MAIAKREDVPASAGVTVGGAEKPRLIIKPKPGAGRGRFGVDLQTSAKTEGGELGGVISQINKMYINTARIASHRGVGFGRIRTGVFVLDLALGGGFCLSKASMLYGEKHTGKSMLAALTVAQAQKAFPDQMAVWLDIEGTFDAAWARHLGVDTDRLYVIEPESGEAAVDMADSLFRAYETSILVVDSVAMLTPTKELDASAEDSIVGVHARMIGRLNRILNQAMLKERHRGHVPALIYINQFRMKIGVMMGDPRTLPGGKSSDFFMSHMVQTYNKEHVIDKGEFADRTDYNEHEFKITKDKTGGRIKAGKYKIIRDYEITGLPVGYIDQTKTVLSFAARAGLATEAAGGNYTIGEHGNFRGADNVTRYFLEHPEAWEALQEQTLEYYRDAWGIDS